jgi:hypothetical protein
VKHGPRVKLTIRCAVLTPLLTVPASRLCWTLSPAMASARSLWKSPDRFARASPVKPFTLLLIISHLSYCLRPTSFKVPNLDGVIARITGGRLNTSMWNTMEIFDGQGRCLDNSAQRGASNECVRLIRKLRWMGMDDEAERLMAQLSGCSFQPTETVIAGSWATD